MEAICTDEEVPSAEVLDVISRLVDKSLVSAPASNEVRFTQLQTLWQYGKDRLAESGEADAIRARHGAYYRQLAEESYDGLRGAAGPVWRERITQELGNLKTALDWHLSTDDRDAALSMASGMAWLWFINTDFAEGARWLTAALVPEKVALLSYAPAPRLGSATASACHQVRPRDSSNANRRFFCCDPGADQLRLAGGVNPRRVRYLVRAHEFSRSLEALAEAQALLNPEKHRWLLGAHDLLVAWNMASFGRLEEAETAADPAFNTSTPSVNSSS